MEYTIEQFNKEAISCEPFKVICKNCGKEWTYGEYSPYDGDFHDGKIFALMSTVEDKEGQKAETHVCLCGVVLRIHIVGKGKEFRNQLPL